MVDDAIKETTVRFDLSFYNPDDEQFVEIRTEKKTSDGLLSLVIDMSFFFVYLHLLYLLLV